jgi:hypothetical protein
MENYNNGEWTIDNGELRRKLLREFYRFEFLVIQL